MMAETMPGGRYEKSAACYRFDAELPAYLEGEDRAELARHAKECLFCGAVLADLELVRSVARQLPLEEPPTILWTNLRARLAAEGILQEPVSGWRRWFEGFGLVPSLRPVAALTCLALFASLVMVPRASFERKEASGLLSVREKAPAASAVADSEEESRLARAVSEVETNFKAREKSLEPAVQATYQKSLDSLDTSIRECRASIRSEPSNTLAREYLLSAYTQKAQVLATALEFDARPAD